MTGRIMLAITATTLVGCTRTPVETQPRAVVVPAGTSIPLVLIDKIESGISREGDPVHLIVSKDVVVDGAVAIRTGAMAMARVAWSRRADPLRMIANQPARLAIAFEFVVGSDGRRLRLSPSPDAEERFAIERSMVGPDQAKEGLGQMLQDAAGKAALEELAKSLERGSLPSSPDTREALQRVANELGLAELQKALAKDDVDRFDQTLQALRGGVNLEEGLGTLAAVLQLASLAGTVGDRLGRMLKSPNIVAHPGTPLIATTAEPATVQGLARR